MAEQVEELEERRKVEAVTQAAFAGAC